MNIPLAGANVKACSETFYAFIMNELADIEDLIETEAEVDIRGLRAGNVKRNFIPGELAKSGQDGNLPGAQSIWLKTFGCSHNTSDSEYMAGQLQDYGYRYPFLQP